MEDFEKLLLSEGQGEKNLTCFKNRNFGSGSDEDKREHLAIQNSEDTRFIQRNPGEHENLLIKAEKTKLVNDFRCPGESDQDYGEHCQQPDIDYEEEKTWHQSNKTSGILKRRKGLQVFDLESFAEKQTITSSKNIMKTITVQKSFHIQSMECGKRHENEAL
ncbi:hypothetical protein FQR65_LT18975 [Abscondita terminalis]|nr:hypothetical protein FQR65_LT18975 [Abscondita terminalis]